MELTEKEIEETIRNTLYFETEPDDKGTNAYLRCDRAAHAIAEQLREEEDELVVWLTAKANTIYDDHEPMDRAQASAYREIVARIEKGGE